MDSTRYLDLYAAEAAEHLSALSQAVLELERTGGSRGTEQAFRAAHTLKGMAGVMGYSDVSAAAHRLEDLLDGVREGRVAPDAETVDRLLALADDVETAVHASLARPDAGATSAASATEAGGGAAPRRTGGIGGDGDAPANAVAVAMIQLRQDTPLPAARAVVLLGRLAEAGPVLGSRPEALDEDFGGELQVHFGRGVDTQMVRTLLEMDADVARFDVVAVGQAKGAAGRTVRVDLRRLDELSDGVAELSILHGRLRALAGENGVLGDVAERTARQVDRLHETVLSLRMVPLREAFERLPRVVRDVARGLGRDVELELRGGDVGLDRAIVDALVDPLIHLLRNAVDHGIETADERRAAAKPETGRLVVAAEREQSRVVIRVSDDGRGVPLERVQAQAVELGLVGEGDAELRGAELLHVLSHAGFSTAERVSEVSGRGVGLDIVAERIRSLGGSVEMWSEVGRGTTFTLRLPLTLAVAQALRVRVGGEDYMIPVTHIVEAVELEPGSVVRLKGRESLRLREDLLPLVRLSGLLGTSEPGRESAAVVAAVGERRAALAVDELVGRAQIVLRSFEAAAGTLRIFGGATLLEDGRPALVLDPVSVL